jgi:hypothetical protein
MGYPVVCVITPVYDGLPGVAERRGFCCVPSMTTAWKWKSSVQPNDGEGLAKRKGVIARWRLEEAWSKAAALWTSTG